MIDRHDIDGHLAQLKSSQDAKELVYSAQAIAFGSNDAAHRQLLQHLSSAAFLAHLDPAAEMRRFAPNRLRIHRVLRALTRDPSDSRVAVLVGLTEAPNFLAAGSRIDLLIDACVVVTPSSPAIIRFWDTYSQPLDGYHNLTAAALLRNGSVTALRLFEQKLADSNHDLGDKILWLRRFLIPRRNQVHHLQMVRRLLQVELPDKLRTALIDVLFDYQPIGWSYPYRCGQLPIDLPSPEAEDELRSIAAYALASDSVSDRTRELLRSHLDRRED